MNYDAEACYFFSVPYSPLLRTTDVVFLLDASQGVRPDLYSKEKEFVKILSKHFDLNTSGPRGSAIIYAENPQTVANFGDSNFAERIDRAALLKEAPRRMDRALERAAQVLTRSGRDGRKIVVLLTTGKQSPGGKALSEAIKPLRQIGAQTFVVPIGREPDVRELYSVVHSPRDISQVLRAEDLLPQSRLVSRKIKDKPGENTYFRIV